MDILAQAGPPHAHYVSEQTVTKNLPSMLADERPPEDLSLTVGHAACVVFPPASFVRTTVIVVLVKRGPQKRRLHIAHVSNSWEVMLESTGEPHTLTDDHSPQLADATGCLEYTGGYVLCGRLNGVLVFSGAVGDRGVNPVICSPRYSVYKTGQGSQWRFNRG